MRGEGLLYFVQVAGNGPIKIGFTGNFEVRMKAIQAWCPLEIKPLLAIRTDAIAEFYSHFCLRAHQMRGEWFHPHPFVSNYIESIRSTGRVPGCPDPIPDHDHRRVEARFNFARVIPAIWPDYDAMSKEIALKGRPDYTAWFGQNMICRTVIAARKHGINLTTAELVIFAAPVPRANRPHKPRKPYKPRAGHEKPPADFLIETRPALKAS